jgi:hypothetical protein
MTHWLLLSYQVPAHPSALRVYVWRKLKRLGAILLDEAVWVLPDTPRTAEHLQWLAAEIQERRGNVNLWKSSLVLGLREEELVKQFKKQVDGEFRELLKKLDTKDPDLAKLSQGYQQIIGKDYFRSEVGQQVKTKLLKLRGETK